MQPEYHEMNQANTATAPRHRRMLLEESGILPEVAGERGYWTATKRDQLGDLNRYQRRVPALVIPTYSPDGDTRSLQIRPDSPRVRDGKTVKYETPKGSRCILDVHPRNLDAIGDAGEELWITEGIKKADALTSRGFCTIGLTGVWNWQRGGELLPDWENVALAGRTVYVVFDSDVMVKPEVDLALERLVGALEARGATVRVVYLPDASEADGSKQGVDDFLVAGGTIGDLYGYARTFERQNYTEARLSRDERLRAAIDEAWDVHESLPTRKDTECTRRAVYRAMLSTAARRGKAKKDGRVGFFLAAGEGALQAGVSQQTFSDHAKGLEAEGYILVERPEDPTKANIYTLPRGRAVGGNSRGAPKEKLCYLTSKTRRGSFSSGGYDHRDRQLRGGQADIPEARRNRLILSWRQDGLGRRVCDVDPLLRLGPRRREILVHLLTRGGEATVEDLAHCFSSSGRPRDFVRRVLRPMVEDFPILAVDDGRVRLLEDWRDGLEKARLAGQEQEAHESQAVRYELKKLAFRGRDKNKPDRAPTQADMDHRRRKRESLAAKTTEEEPMSYMTEREALLAEADAIDRATELEEDSRPIYEIPTAIPAEEEPVTVPEKPVLSDLAEAVRDYLDRNPHRRTETASWLAVTVWAEDLYPGKPTVEEVSAALEELAGLGVAA